MVVAYAWIDLSGSFAPYASFLALGGPIAVGAAAILGRRSSLTIKQLIFLVFACSLLGYIANAVVYNMWLLLAAQAEAALPIGWVAGTAMAVLAAYLAGLLARRGARARRDEEIADTFG